MNYLFGIIGSLTLIASALIPSPTAAICGVLLIVGAGIIGCLEKILSELRAARPSAKRPTPEELVADKEILEARDKRLAKQAAVQSRQPVE